MASVLTSGMTAVVGVLDSCCGESGYFSLSTGYIPGHIDLPNSVLFANTAELSVIGSDSPMDANSLIDDVNGWDWEADDNAPADEPGFWDTMTPFYERLPGVSQFGVETTADKLGWILTGGTAAAFAAHGVAKAVRRRVTHQPLGPARGTLEVDPDELDDGKGEG